MTESEVLDTRVGDAHITPEQIMDVNIGTYGPGDYVLPTGKKLKPQLLSNNTVRIFDGVMVYSGVRDVIAVNNYYDVTIENGAQGMNRNDIIVRHFEKSEETQMGSATFRVIKGTPASGTATDPDVAETNLRTGALEHDMHLYRVKLEGLSVVKIEPLFEELPSVQDLKEQLTELNGKTMELICETSATSYTTFSGLDLSKYKYFILNTGTKSSNIRKVNATAIIPREFMQYTGTSNIQEASFAKEPSYYCATMYFISESAVAMKSTSIYDYAWLYGMP